MSPAPPVRHVATCAPRLRIVLVLLAVCSLSAQAQAAACHANASNPVAVGAIRWDAWNGVPGDFISQHETRVMSPAAWHSRLPWFAEVHGPNSISFDGDRQSIFDQELEYAAAAGLKFFAYDTYCVYPGDGDLPQCAGYWGGETPTSKDYMPSDPAYGLRLHRQSSLKHLVDFTLLLLGASPAHPRMRQRYLPLFKDPSYHRVCGGRPLVFLFQASDNDAAMNGGWDEWRKDWDAFRAESLAQGTGDPYLVALDLSLEVAMKIRAALGFDAVSAYALPAGARDEGAPFAVQHQNAVDFWKGADESGVPCVPPIPTGWDPRPRAQTPDPWVDEGPAHFEEATPEELTALFREAVSWAGSHEGPRAALAYAWNENSEGGPCLIPTIGDGPARVNAVARALRPDVDAQGGTPRNLRAKVETMI